jgi:membrane-associated protein
VPAPEEDPSPGGLVWSVGLVCAGYGPGRFVPGADAYLLPVIAVIVVVSLLPLARELLAERRRRRADPAR